MLTEILSSHADRLNLGDENTQDFLALFSEYRSELAPLLRLAAEIKSVLYPVPPRAAFRTDLYQALIAAGYRQRSQRVSGLPLARDVRRDWMLGAAAVGSAVSVVGVIAYLWRSRTTTDDPSMSPH